MKRRQFLVGAVAAAAVAPAAAAPKAFEATIRHACKFAHDAPIERFILTMNHGGINPFGFGPHESWGWVGFSGPNQLWNVVSSVLVDSNTIVVHAHPVSRDA